MRHRLWRVYLFQAQVGENDTCFASAPDFAPARFSRRRDRNTRRCADRRILAVAIRDASLLRPQQPFLPNLAYKKLESNKLAA